MHRPALAAGAAVTAAEQLGEQPAEIAPLREIEGVTPVGREEEVRGPESVAGAHREGLLADAEVHGTLDAVARIEGDDPLLDHADPQRPDDEALPEVDVGHRGSPVPSSL